jgi:hypothetical protein
MARAVEYASVSRRVLTPYGLVVAALACLAASTALVVVIVAEMLMVTASTILTGIGIIERIAP